MSKVNIHNIAKPQNKTKVPPIDIRIESVEQISSRKVTLVFTYNRRNAPKDANWYICTLNGQIEPEVRRLGVNHLIRGAVDVTARKHCKMWIRVCYRASGMLSAQSKRVDVVLKRTKLSIRLMNTLRWMWVFLKRTFWYTNEL